MTVLARVVFDTSTLIGVLLRPASVPRAAFIEAQRRFELCVSQATLAELEVVLRRPKFNAYLTLASRMEFLALCQSKSTMCMVDAASDALARGICRDAKDAMFLALAHACEAQVLVTSDDDLLVLGTWQGTVIKRPAQFLETHAR